MAARNPAKRKKDYFYSNFTDKYLIATLGSAQVNLRFTELVVRRSYISLFPLNGLIFGAHFSNIAVLQYLHLVR